MRQDLGHHGGEFISDLRGGLSLVHGPHGRSPKPDIYHRYQIVMAGVMGERKGDATRVLRDTGGPGRSFCPQPSKRGGSSFEIFLD